MADEDSVFSDADDEAPDPKAVRKLPKRERDYLVPAKDTKGISARAQCRVQPEIMRTINELVVSRKYPFRVQGDLIRWCIVDGVNRLAEGAGVKSVLAQADAQMRMLQDEEYHLQFAEHYRMLGSLVERYLQRGAPAMARALVTRILTNIRTQMPGADEEGEGGYWRLEYEREILEKYGSLLDGADTVGSESTGGVWGDAGTDDEH